MFVVCFVCCQHLFTCPLFFGQSKCQQSYLKEGRVRIRGQGTSEVFIPVFIYKGTFQLLGVCPCSQEKVSSEVGIYQDDL